MTVSSLYFCLNMHFVHKTFRNDGRPESCRQDALNNQYDSSQIWTIKRLRQSDVLEEMATYVASL